MGRCDPGLKATKRLTVTDAHTAVALGSGDVAVLATPAILALAEGACVAAIADDLPDGETSVGAWAEVEHMRAAPLGASVAAHALLLGHHKRRLEFSVSVEADGQEIAKVRHRRILVDRARFLDGAAPSSAPVQAP
jgi:predicted thioesterase